MLKDLIYDIWTETACESPTDTLKLMSLVDFYLPFLPLEREHIRALFDMRLQAGFQSRFRRGHNGTYLGHSFASYPKALRSHNPLAPLFPI